MSALHGRVDLFPVQRHGNLGDALANQRKVVVGMREERRYRPVYGQVTGAECMDVAVQGSLRQQLDERSNAVESGHDSMTSPAGLTEP